MSLDVFGTYEKNKHSFTPRQRIYHHWRLLNSSATDWEWISQIDNLNKFQLMEFLEGVYGLLQWIFFKGLCSFSWYIWWWFFKSVTIFYRQSFYIEFPESSVVLGLCWLQHHLILLYVSLLSSRKVAPPPIKKSLIPVKL